ncbi:hypothetical protein [Nocardia flavorosea]|uniref:Uncharacterized protein n=1 Tax=Nocardia flavorosea TaxID=53429 RepID=A0A846Y613_9NOCA|nr:hypothetical protein [Nocardia flavorosea]NKY54643.1 hypothetical protein [Nocardia flavorosea]
MLFSSDPHPADTSATRSQERRIIASFRTEREVARYIDDPAAHGGHYIPGRSPQR